MFTISMLLWFYENLNSNTTGPAGWFASQGFVLLYHHLDNLNNTCGLSFNFENDKDNSSRTSSETSRDSEPEVVVVETVDADGDDGETPQDEESVSIFEETDQEGGALLITNKILHKLFVKEFKVVCETGR